MSFIRAGSLSSTNSRMILPVMLNFSNQLGKIRMSKKFSSTPTSDSNALNNEAFRKVMKAIYEKKHF